jgi:hypothetical protein
MANAVSASRDLPGWLKRNEQPLESWSWAPKFAFSCSQRLHLQPSLALDDWGTSLPTRSIVAPVENHGGSALNQVR